MESNRVLVLDFNDDTEIATCFDRKEKRTLKIRVDLDRDPIPGQFIQYLKTAELRDGIVTVTFSNARIEGATADDCVQMVNGQLRISSWIGFSDKPNHRTYDRNVAFGDWYGFIDNSKFRDAVIKLGNKTGKRMFTSTIVVKDLNYLENNTQLFEVFEVRYAIVGEKKENVVQQCLRNLDSYEEAIAASEQQGMHRRSDSTISSQANPNPHTQQVFAAIQNRGMARPASVVLTASIPPHPGNTQPRSSSVVPPSCRASLQFELCQSAIAMTKCFDNSFVVWMNDQKAVAMLTRNCPGYQSVRLGSTFECVYLKQGDIFQVQEVRRMIERAQCFPVSEVDDKCFEAQFVVDLCTPNFNFNFWTIYTGIAVLNAEEVSLVTTADKIEVPDGSTRRFYEMMRTYMGEPLSRRMACWCQLEEQRLPRMVVDPGYEGYEIVRRYHWKLYKVTATSSIAERRSIEQRMNNLGVRSSDYETTDDVARCKREIQQNLSFGRHE